jgi:hypothetical protein
MNPFFNNQSRKGKLLRNTVAVAGFISSFIGIYTFFFQNSKPNLKFEITSNTSVTGNNFNDSTLDISYQNSRLKESHESLKIINLKVSNTGGGDILASSYDSQFPIGFRVSGGSIIEKPRILSASNKYIKEKLQINSDSTKLDFNNVILESESFYIVEILIIHPESKDPSFEAYGKVAGQKEISLVSLMQDGKQEDSFWNKVFSGNLYVQLMRLLLYTIGFLGFFIMLLFSIAKTIDYIGVLRRRATVKRYQDSIKNNYNRMDEVIFRRFEKEGPKRLKYFLYLLDQESQMQRVFEYIESQKNIFERAFGNLFHPFTKREIDCVKFLVDDCYLVKDNDSVIVNKRLKESLEVFLKFIDKERDESLALM